MQEAERGFSMIEVLVSVAILSLGILGIAALQTTSYKYNHGAYLRTVATNEVYAIIDRMRANPVGVSQGNYNALVYTDSGTTSTCAECTPEQIATNDNIQWSQAIRHALPSGQGSVTFNPSTGLYDVRVMWDGNRNGATGTGCGSNPLVDMTCISVNIRL